METVNLGYIDLATLYGMSDAELLARQTNLLWMINTTEVAKGAYSRDQAARFKRENTAINAIMRERQHERRMQAGPDGEVAISMISVLGRLLAVESAARTVLISDDDKDEVAMEMAIGILRNAVRRAEEVRFKVPLGAMP